MDNRTGKWTTELNATVFKLSPRSSDVVGCRFGPPKEFARALEKTKKATEELKKGEVFMGLKDLNRVTFEFEDPFVMALCFECIKVSDDFTLAGLKNKYLQESYEQPPDLHMNLDMGDGWLVEVRRSICLRRHVNASMYSTIF